MKSKAKQSNPIINFHWYSIKRRFWITYYTFQQQTTTQKNPAISMKTRGNQTFFCVTLHYSVRRITVLLAPPSGQLNNYISICFTTKTLRLSLWLYIPSILLLQFHEKWMLLTSISGIVDVKIDWFLILQQKYWPSIELWQSVALCWWQVTIWTG